MHTNLSKNIQGSRFLFSFILIFAFFVCVPFQANSFTLEEEVEKLVSSPSVSKDKMGLIIYDLRSDQLVASHNSDVSLVPASVMKAVTTASLANATSTDKILSTRVYYSGSLDDGVLDGNILVVGCGDPSINAPSGPESSDILDEIVQAVKNEKIKTINGKIIVEKDIFCGPATPPSWQAGDLPHYYGTGCHGFNFESNSSGKKSVADPSAVFIKKLTGRLASSGITVRNGNINDDSPRTLIAEHRSAPLEEIMRSCMLRSDNLFAESLFRMVALEYGLTGSTENAARRVSEHWSSQNLPMQGVSIIDGSGLSRSNRLTANFLAEVLKQMKNNEIYVSFFPLVGEEGTVRNFMKDTPLAGYMALKTGSMKGIQCYAGYKLDDAYAPTHVVVVIVNDLKNRDAFRRSLADFFINVFYAPN